MPEISRFFGIVVQMYYADHDPPHFHVRYAGRRAPHCYRVSRGFAWKSFAAALGLVTEWAALHRTELTEDWALARAEAQLNPIAPLE
jgi:hypothetical protein